MPKTSVSISISRFLRLGVVRARVVGPQKVAGTLHSETPWALGGGEGTIREISMTGFEECKWLPKNVKPSPSVAARRLKTAPIFR